MKIVYAALISATIAAGIVSILSPTWIMYTILLALTSRVVQSELQRNELIHLRSEVESLRLQIGRAIERRDL